MPNELAKISRQNVEGVTHLLDIYIKIPERKGKVIKGLLPKMSRSLWL